MPTFRSAASAFSAAASSDAASRSSPCRRGAAEPRHMRPLRGRPPPPVIVPDSLISSPCTYRQVASPQGRAMW